MITDQNKPPKAGNNNGKGGKPLNVKNTPALSGFNRKIWLNYYNDYLHTHGIITESKWRKIRRLIEQS